MRIFVRFDDRISEWDVCNEHLHKHYYEDKTQDKDMLIKEFQKAYSTDPNPRLYLNDYEVVKKGSMTSVSASTLYH